MPPSQFANHHRPVASPGVASELVLGHGQTYRGEVGEPHWMLVRTLSGFTLLVGKASWKKSFASEGADRGLCAPGVWRKRLEIPVAPAAVLHEEVLLGNPPVPFPCASTEAQPDEWD
jgi:hypothetical protein